MSAQPVPARRATGVLVRYTTRDGSPCTADLADAVTTRFEDLPAHREVVSYKRQRNFTGLWWFATRGSHVPYESWVERDQVMVMDRCPEVVAVRSQPFALNVSVGTRSVWHVPDYFVRLHDGRARVVDVRPAKRIDEQAREVFEATAQECTRIGWDYTVVGELSPVLRANLRWLAGYRHARNGRAGVAWDLLRAVVTERGQVPLGELPALTRAPGAAVLPQVFHRLWTSQLGIDLSRLMSLGSLVTAGELC